MDLFTEITGHIYCKECGASIPYDRRYIEENCRYQVSDYTNCLCPDCSAKLRESWKPSQPRKLYRGCTADFTDESDKHPVRNKQHSGGNGI